MKMHHYYLIENAGAARGKQIYVVEAGSRDELLLCRFFDAKRITRRKALDLGKRRDDRSHAFAGGFVFTGKSDEVINKATIATRRAIRDAIARRRKIKLQEQYYRCVDDWSLMN